MNQTDHYLAVIEHRVIVIRCFGHWDVSIAEALLEVVRELIAALPPGEPWATFVDFTQWQDMTPETLDIANEVIRVCDANGRKHSAFMMGSLEVGRRMIEKQVIDPERTHVRHFQTEARAREWLTEHAYLKAT